MKKIVIADNCFGIVSSDRIKLHFNGVKNEIYEADKLTKKDLSELRQSPNKAIEVITKKRLKKLDKT